MKDLTTTMHNLEGCVSKLPPNPDVMHIALQEPKYRMIHEAALAHFNKYCTGKRSEVGREELTKIIIMCASYCIDIERETASLKYETPEEFCDNWSYTSCIDTTLQIMFNRAKRAITNRALFGEESSDLLSYFELVAGRLELYRNAISEQCGRAAVNNPWFKHCKETKELRLYARAHWAMGAACQLFEIDASGADSKENLLLMLSFLQAVVHTALFADGDIVREYEWAPFLVYENKDMLDKVRAYFSIDGVLSLYWQFLATPVQMGLTVVSLLEDSAQYKSLFKLAWDYAEAAMELHAGVSFSDEGNAREPEECIDALHCIIEEFDQFIGLTNPEEQELGSLSGLSL